MSLKEQEMLDFPEHFVSVAVSVGVHFVKVLFYFVLPECFYCYSPIFVIVIRIATKDNCPLGLLYLRLLRTILMPRLFIYMQVTYDVSSLDIPLQFPTSSLGPSQNSPPHIGLVSLQ